MIFPSTIIVRTPLIVNTFAPVGQAMVRSHFIDITFLFPFTPYDSSSVTVVTVGLAVLE